MQIIIVLGVIAALIYYFIKMRANAKQSDEESDTSSGRGFMNDMFISPNSETGSDPGVGVDRGDELDDDFDDEQDGKKLLSGDPYGDLEKLAALHEKGILTQEEYAAKKKEMLDRI